MENEQEEKNWVQRNWKWFIPVGCLGSVAACMLCIGLIFGVVIVSIRASTPYQDGLARAQNSAEVQAALGPPIEPGLFIQGNISVENSSGDANFQVPLNGTSDSGTLYVVAVRSGGVWEFIELEVETDYGQVIDLR